MSGKDVDIEHWSRIASEWMTWARAPNHDAFWAYRASLLAFIGQGAGHALDVGCGGPLFHEPRPKFLLSNAKGPAINCGRMATRLSRSCSSKVRLAITAPQSCTI